MCLLALLSLELDITVTGFRGNRHNAKGHQFMVDRIIQGALYCLMKGIDIDDDMICCQHQ